MAAITSRASRCMDVAQVAMVFTLLLAVAVVCAGGRSPRANQICGDVDVDTAVYPYWSTCNRPAVYIYGGEAYEVAEPLSGLLLAPEWDESNSTYYVRLVAEGGATYAFAHLTRELRPYVSLSESLYFINQDSGRVLAWRNEGEDEDFLVEVEADSGLALFQFASTDLLLPCPRILFAQCKAYSILDFNSTSGLAPYVEDDVTYFKKSATDLAALVLLRTSNDSSLSVRKDMIASVV